MKLIETNGFVGMPSAEASLIHEFNVLIKRDRTKDKKKASRELAYIYLMVDPDSPYITYSDDTKSKQILKDLFDESYEVDDALNAALEKYKALTVNEYTDLLEATREAANKLKDYFRTMNLDEVDDNGKPTYSAKDLIANLSKVGSVMEGIDKLKEMVEKNKSKENQNRAGVKTNEFNQ